MAHNLSVAESRRNVHGSCEVPRSPLLNRESLRICLVGVNHICHNPRLVREADSLAAAGHDVRVVSPSFSIDLKRRDEAHVRRRGWRHQPVTYVPNDLKGWSRSLLLRSRRRIAVALHKAFDSSMMAHRGYITAFPELCAQAASEDADWFIAHAHGALPIAAGAAKLWQSRLGFDCEDLLAEHGEDPVEMVRQIERTYLPDCDYVSAPSRGIAVRLQRDYAIPSPVVLYNVFPLHLAIGMKPPSQREGTRALRLHWFGQTIGPGRGIEEAIAACGLLGGDVELVLRGNVAIGYEQTLRSLASHHEVQLSFLPQIEHDDLVRSMDEFDVGLALEREERPNCALTVSNKIGSYLLAGLAIAATGTSGQREILETIPDVGFCYGSGNAQDLAHGLRRWLNNREALKLAQQASWSAARKQFCWDIEQKKLLLLLNSS